MDKNAIKKYAVWARNELIARVSQKALQYGITEDNIVDATADSINGKLLTDIERKQRQALIVQIKDKGFEQVMEEVAYTWFNRFSALRFMEVNGYLPTHVRVFTDEENNFKPQIITEAIHLEMDGLDMEKVYAFKDADKTEELYKYLLITQCNALNKILPGMFQRIADYTELLLPDNLLREGSVIQRMIAEIPQDNFDFYSENGQVEILGWLYQFYISEKHDKVVDPLHGKIVDKDDVPAATQLFTTDWVVRYIIDNSVGRYWIERNPNSSLRAELEYFVEPKSSNIPTVNEKIIPQELTVFDPCVGSGHFLVYAFEVLMKIYMEYGYSEREAALEIVQNNIYGLDIDERASQLAYFAVMMKARQYDRRFFSRGIQPHIFAVRESNRIDNFIIEYFCNNNASLKKDMGTLISAMKDAKEYGTIIQIPQVDFAAINSRFVELEEDISIYRNTIINVLRPFTNICEIMSKKYSVVATNPPYLNKYDSKLKKFVTDSYKDYSGDLFSVFMYRNFAFCKKDGYSGFMTPNVWMFIKSYEKLRTYIIENKGILTLIQMAKGAFFKEATVDVCAFVLTNFQTNCQGLFFRLDEFKGDMEVQNQKVLEGLKDKKCKFFYETDSKNFDKIASSPIAFWASQSVINAYEVGRPISDIGETRQGMASSDDGRFVRFWYEVNYNSIGFESDNAEEATLSKKKWFPYNKGGSFRKWYGNNTHLINYENDGFEVKEYASKLYKTASRTIKSTDVYFKEGATWSAITSGGLSLRWFGKGFVISNAGMALYANSKNELLYLIGLLNSKVTVDVLVKVLNESLNFNAGDISRIPVIKSNEETVVNLVRLNIELSEREWNSFETSWDFRNHPLLPICADMEERTYRLSDIYEDWERCCHNRFDQLKANEEALNSIFIDIYGFQNELIPEVDDKDVTVRLADRSRDIKSLISFAVGCMFGRYSLWNDGIAYAGGEWDDTQYSHFKADGDGIIPICDDEYFHDDIVGKFIDFMRIAYGEETLQENLKYVAEAIGGKGTPKEVIRNYFLNDFFSEHCKMYQKRPIYWQFDSGKKNGFKCLIYMHRYQPDTIARIRTDYVHEQQSRYRTAIADLEQRINGASTSERVKLNKQLQKLQSQEAEVRSFEEKMHHLADQMIRIDLDDGVKNNYEIFKDVLAKIK